jgi:ribosomal protein L11 methyltransferase
VRRVSVSVPRERAEQARATMVELFPQGFEEREDTDGVILVAYTDAAGEERMWAAFGSASGDDVADGWEERWRAFHRPIRAGALWVGPPWEEPDAGAVAVVIDPGRAFGTGGHATTRLCLELLVETDRGAILDVGCGSGVLAVAAARLGFAPVVAVDVEPPAVEATLANAAANGVVVDARVADATREPLPSADIAVTNIALDVVEAVAPRLAVGRLLTSGYLAADAPVLRGYERVARRERDGWAADVFVSRND